MYMCQDNFVADMHSYIYLEKFTFLVDIFHFQFLAFSLKYFLLKNCSSEYVTGSGGRFSNSRPVKQGVTSLPPGVSDDASLQPGATAIDEPGSTIIIEPGAGIVAAHTL